MITRVSCAIPEVERQFYASFERDFLFANHTTVGCGARAIGAFYPKTLSELVALTKKLQSFNAEYCILGRGSNVLPPDCDYGGYVILTEGVQVLKIRRNGRVFASCGVKAQQLIDFALVNSLSGLEFLTGIPATVGGLVYMNAGTSDRHVCDVVESVVSLTKDGVTVRSAKDCLFGNKASAFMENGELILGVNFSLQRAEREEILTRLEGYQKRRRSLPQGRSMGCVFKNPHGLSAGALIEMAGLKGTRIGGAIVSERHANFIINENNATSEDIALLIFNVKRRVLRFCGVHLTEEIQYIGKK